MASSAYELLEAYVQFATRGLKDVLLAIQSIEAATRRVTTATVPVTFSTNASTVLTSTQGVEAAWTRTNAAIAQVNSQLVVTQQRLQSIAAAQSTGAITGGASSGATTAGVLAVRQATASATQAQAAFAGASSSALSFVGGLAAAAAGAAAFGIVLAGLRTGLNEAFAQERTAITFRALTGDAQLTLGILNELADFAQESPFAFPELRETAQRMLAVGVSTDSLVETLKTLSQISAVSGANLNLLTKAYTDTLAKGKLTAQELNQFANSNIPLLEELSKTLGRPRDEIKRLAEDGLISADAVTEALSRMVAEGGRFAGVMEGINTLTPEIIKNISEDVVLISAHLTRWSVNLFKEDLTAVKTLLDFIENKLRNVTSFGSSDIAKQVSDGATDIASQRSALSQVFADVFSIEAVLPRELQAVVESVREFTDALEANEEAKRRAASAEVKLSKESRAAAQLRVREAEASALASEEAAAKIVAAWEKELDASDRKFTQFWKSIQRTLKQESEQQLSDTIRQIESDNSAAEALRRSLMTPMDEFRERILEAQELLSKGLISDTEFNATLKDAKNDLEDIEKTFRAIGKDTKLSVLGSQEFFKFELSASREQSQQLIELRQQLRQDAERNRILTDVKLGIDKLNDQRKTPEVTAESFPSEIF